MSTIAPTERRFGVEIECGHTNGYGWVREELGRAGVPHSSVGCDGSGVEVRTRVLKGKRGFSELKRLLKHLETIGCFITRSDGQHIHIEAKDYIDDPEARARLVESYTANRDTIVQFVDPYRRNYGSCSNIWEDASRKKKPRRDLLNGVKSGQFYGRGDLNLSNLKQGYIGTVEIRLHEGNLDFDKIEAWIQFWIEFLNRVKASNKPLRSYKADSTLFRGVGVDPEVRKKLKEAAQRYNAGIVIPPRTASPSPVW